MPREKAWWEQHKKAECCFVQILETAPHKTAAVQPLTSHLTKHLSEMKKRFRSLLKKKGWTHKESFPTHSCTSISWPAKTYIHQLCADTGCSQEDLSRVMTTRYRWWDRVNRICAVDPLMSKKIMSELKYKAMRIRNMQDDTYKNDW